MTPDKSPTFNLKVVVNETGLKPDTLRAWERRYGLPNPERTDGGHRLYSQYDIDTLKWLVNRQSEGLSISRAVKLWRQLRDSGEEPLDTKQDVYVESVPVVVDKVYGDKLTTLRSAWLEACYVFEAHTADSILTEAFSLFPVEMVCFELLQRGLAETGMGWYEGRVTVQQEHFTSSLATRRLETLVASAPPASRNGRILALCPPEENHTFGLLLVTLLLRRAGWDVIYLGANVPIARLESTLKTTRPNLVLLAAQTLYTASTMLAMAKWLKEKRMPVAYGGRIFSQLPSLCQKIPAHYLGGQMNQMAHQVEQLLTSSPSIPALVQLSDEYEIVLREFLKHQVLLEAEVWKILQGSRLQIHLSNANKEFAQNIVAALAFGDISLLDVNLKWIEGLLLNYEFDSPQRILEAYMQAYYQASKKVLGTRGELIVSWLSKLLSE